MYQMESGFVMAMELATLKDFEVIRVIDGDTIEVTFPDVPAIFGKFISIRIRRMSAPEIRTKDLREKAYGYKAKSFLEDLLSAGSEITLRNVERGKYFRLVADVIIDGHSVKQAMFKAGYAVLWKKGHPKPDWSKMEF